MTWQTGTILILAVYSVTTTIWGALDRRETRREARRTRIALEIFAEYHSQTDLRVRPRMDELLRRRLAKENT